MQLYVFNLVHCHDEFELFYITKKLCNSYTKRNDKNKTTLNETANKEGFLMISIAQ